jgi:GDP-D-mannose dehydratase
MPVPPADVRFRVGLSEKAKTLLGWSPRHELDHIIDDSLAFIREKLPKKAS